MKLSISSWALAAGIVSLVAPMAWANEDDADEMVREGIRQILSAEKEQLWYEGVYRVRGEVPLGYRAGGTAIACTALLAAPWVGKEEARQAKIEGGLDFILESLDHPLLSAEYPGGYDVRGWAHIYVLEFLVRFNDSDRLPRGRRGEIDEGIRFCVEALEQTEIPGAGGWNYSRSRVATQSSPPSSMMTAAAVLALIRARKAGADVDPEVVVRAMDALERGRVSSGAFQYSVNPDRVLPKGFDSVPGAIARTPICEVALYLGNRGTVERIRKSVDDFFEHWKHLENRRKQAGTHAPPYMIAPYYFFFGHRYAAEAIEFLPAEEREAYRGRMRDLLVKVRDADGTWNDRVFPRSKNYSTAMAVLSLTCPVRSRPPRWAKRRVY
ncbi:MAG: hypothetical protein O7H41_19015 [Planctomycetota bacterium]|nr:hypothetical protein [Planctomycetota bacterium]